MRGYGTAARGGNADIRQIARVGYGGNNRRRTGLIAAIAHGVVSVFEGQADEVPQIARAQPVATRMALVPLLNASAVCYD
jgi:hypothetical protein